MGLLGGMANVVVEEGDGRRLSIGKVILVLFVFLEEKEEEEGSPRSWVPPPPARRPRAVSELTRAKGDPDIRDKGEPGTRANGDPGAREKADDGMKRAKLGYPESASP